MSNLVFPSSLLGIGIGVKRTPFWSGAIQDCPSGKEVRVEYFSTPRWRYQLPLNFARVTGFSAQTPSNEMAIIQAMFNGVKGQWDSFLFTDTYSNTAAATAFGTGTGGAGQTNQLLDIEGFPIYDLNGTAQIFVAGVLQTVTTNDTLSATGLVTWVTQPASSAALTWSGAYYRRCRFDMDAFELEQLLNLCWGKGVIKMVSLK